MRRSKKLFLLFVIIWLLTIIYLMVDFSNKSKAPWKKSATNNELTVKLIH
jgi:hypothetical protein|tara:strand:- start:2211 stop:2360 length:150 start_codon:yes stop_codon:yes gene_type:complete